MRHSEDVVRQVALVAKYDNFSHLLGWFETQNKAKSRGGILFFKIANISQTSEIRIPFTLPPIATNRRIDNTVESLNK
jgi:hypothetical protein